MLMPVGVLLSHTALKDVEDPRHMAEVLRGMVDQVRRKEGPVRVRVQKEGEDKDDGELSGHCQL